MQANDSAEGLNACAIEKNVRYTYFRKIVGGIYIKTEVPYGNW